MHTSTRLQLALILGAYFLLGFAFASQVPAWQAPDEPAHYNYTRQLARGQLPVLEMGDYEQQLIERDIAPPDKRPTVSLDGVQYEDHQPPLFYALAVPVFVAANGSLLALRLFGLCAGALAVAFAYFSVLEIFPAHSTIAAFAAALVALLPQHVHMLSSFNNDALAEALLMCAVWQSLRLIRAQRAPSTWSLVALGVTVGLCFITKTTAYFAAPVAAYAVWRSAPDARPLSRATLTRVGALALVACLIGLPWWLRDVSVYGGSDILGLQRHNAIVVGQPTTSEWLALYGAGGLLARLLQTTFQSFWGQFGWMSVVLDSRLYLAFFAFTAASAGMFVAWWVSVGRAQTAWPTLSTPQRRQLNALWLLALLAVMALVWYNLQFVQHQGRYLFPALASFATAASLGWHFVFVRRPVIQRWLWLAMLVALTALDAYLLWRVIAPAMATR